MILLILHLLLTPFAQAGVGPNALGGPDGPDGPDDEWERIVDLRGTWQFNLGDDLTWADADANDKDWETIFVPGRWEEEGYWGYDGYAWYRKGFRLPKEVEGRALYIDVGRTDDVSAVYINGHFVGNVGRFPPEYDSAFHVFNRYRIPEEFLVFGGYNVVAVRVYDRGGEGGLLEGRHGIYARQEEVQLAVDLSGTWQFRPGDRMTWRSSNKDDADWEEISVPARWEAQGYAEYDGFAWYRKTFYVPSSLQGEDLVLLLGKIDDFDETFLNGEQIGATGNMQRRELEGWEYQSMRAYPIPREAIRFGAENVLSVRVFDGYLDGGIYEGLIGIVRADEVNIRGRGPRHNPQSAWEKIMDWFFNDNR